MLPLIAWIRWCLLGFSTARLLCYSVSLSRVSCLEVLKYSSLSREGELSLAFWTVLQLLSPVLISLPKYSCLWKNSYCPFIFQDTPPPALGFLVHSLSQPPHHMLLILIIFLKDCDPCCIWVMTAPLFFPLNTSHQEVVLTHRARTSLIHKVVGRETLKTMNIHKFMISVPVTYAY